MKSIVLKIVVVIGFIFPWTIIVGMLPFKRTTIPQIRGRQTIVDSVSRKNLLNIQRDGLYKLPKKSYKSTPTHLRVCAIRVEFQPDSSTRTTGDGLFDLSPREQTPYPIDPTPHDSVYFMAHLDALSKYWYYVSDSKLTLEFDLWPHSLNGAYRLPDSMGYYGLNSWFTSYQDALGQLFIDAFNLAYAIDSIDYSQYDSYILFHAGADMQGDIGAQYEWLDPTTYIPSPDDLPTAFITFGEPVVNGIISEGHIIPEYTSQDGQIGALNGVLAHEFGHQLGLVDLYNTSNFITQIGDFSLMDDGGMIWVEIPGIGDVHSLLPAYPSAWERAYLGFEDFYTISDSVTNIILQAPEKFMADGHTIIKVPINEFEYFLIENRQANFGPDTTIYLDLDSVSGVIKGPIYENERANSKYDYLLPGEGILIWHINERVAYEDIVGNGKTNFENNTLQWNPFRRFVDLEEADGIEDLGFIITYGEPDDYFFAGYKNSFTPNTFPNTNASNNSKSHIYVTNISASDDSMSLNIYRRTAFDNFIRYCPGINYSPLIIADVIAGQGKEIFLSVDDKIYGWFGDGSKIIDNADSVALLDYKNDTIIVPVAIFAQSNSNEILSIPTFFDIDNDSTIEILASGYDGNLYIFKPTDNNHDGRADLYRRINFNTPFRFPPIVKNIGGDTPFIFLASTDGKIFMLNNNFDTVFEYDVAGEINGMQYVNSKGLYVLAQRGRGKLFYFSLADGGYLIRDWVIDLPGGNLTPLSIGDLNGDGNEDLVTISRDGYILAFNLDGTYLPNYPVQFQAKSSVSLPAIGDIDGDGFSEIVFGNGDSLYAYSYEGVREMEFPIKMNFNSLGAPILVDLDNDGIALEIIVPDADGSIYAYNKKGKLLNGFTISSGSVFSLASGDIDNNNVTEIVALTFEGVICVYNIASIYPRANDYGWLMWGANSEHSFRFNSINEPRVISDKIIDKFFNYPNPAEDITYLRVNLNRNATLEINIYDIEGREIFSRNNLYPIGKYFELPFDTRELPSGVFYARLVANLNGNKETKFTKIAVIKKRK